MMNEWVLSASLLIAAVLAGRFLLRGKISLRLQYGLWLVVLLRLLLPVQLFTSSYGAGSIARDVDISAPVRQVYTSAREDSYEREYDEAYQRVVDEYEARNQPYAPADAELEAQAIARESLELDLTKLLYAVWFAGMAVMTAVIISCNVHLSLQLRRRRYEFPTLDCLLPVYVTEAVPTPCLFGIFHPAIYLTPEAAGDEQVRRHVLTHELTHCRHWDHIWSVLRSFCLVLHWYNPLVWAAAKVSRADAELACDEGALARLGEDHRADYGRTLIGLTCGERIGSVFLNATTMTGSAGSIRERIKLLMKRPRNTVLALTALVLIGTMVVGCSFAGAPETSRPTEPAETTNPTESAETTEPTGHTPTPDLSDHSEQLPIPDDPGEPTEPVDQAEEVAALFGEGADPWYLSALTVLYPAPYDFDAQAFFCNGQTSVALTGQEKGILTDAYGKEALEKPLFRMTEERMDNILQQYIGIGAWDVDLSGFLFCPETGAYLKVKDSVGDLPVPEIISCETLAENQVRMIYTLPGREQRYAATLLKGENWKVYSNQMVISKPLAAGTRALTEAEIEQVGDAFQPVIEDEALGESYANPLACMVNDFYDDVTQMDRSAFLRNFPYEEAGTEEDFQLLKKKYPDVFENEETIRDMPVPIHRYDPKTLNETLGRYADIRWEDLPWDEELHYLEETGCFYNYFSDFSVRGFHCTGGWVYDGGATLCSNESVLILTERNGEYFIQAHLPAIVG